MRGLRHASPLFAVLFIEVLVFLALARRGVTIPLGAGIACVFAVIWQVGRLLLREEQGQRTHWTRILRLRQLSAENRLDLYRTASVALLFALVMIGAANFFDKL